MLNCCNGPDLKSICENFNCDIEKTTNGIKIELQPKDSSKIKPFQNFIEACQELCDCDCK